MRAAPGGGKVFHERFIDVGRRHRCEIGAVAEKFIGGSRDGVVRAVVVHDGCKLADDARALIRFARGEPDVLRIERARLVLPEDIAAVGEEISCGKVLIVQRLHIAELRTVGGGFDLGGKSVKIRPVFHHVGDTVLVVVPFLLPVFGEQVFAVVEKGLLHVDGNGEGVLRLSHLHPIGIPGLFGDLRIGLHLLDGKGLDVLVECIAHEDVVRLIDDVGSVPRRAELFEVGIGAHVGVHRLDAVLRIFFVEGAEKLVKIPRLLRRIVVEDLQGHIFFQNACKTFLRFLILPLQPEYPEGRHDRDDGERMGKEQRDRLCHIIPPRSFRS